MTERPLDVLRRTVLTEGGDWTADRAVRTLAHCYGGTTPTAGRGRAELNNLVEEGLLVKHGQIGRLWTLTQKAEELQPARRIAERIAGGLAECEQHGDLASSWYGYVDLEDVRALVAAVLGGPFPQDRMEP